MTPPEPWISDMERAASAADIQALPPSTERVFVERLDDVKATALARLHRLQVVLQDGGSAGLTDAGLAALARLASLQVLDLEWAEGITDRGLAALGALPELRWLDLGGCTGISDGAIAELQRACPRVVIQR